MALNIPNQLPTGWEPLKQGFNTGVNFYDKIVNQGLTRAQQQKIQEMLPIEKKHMLAQIANAAAANSRAAQLQPLRLQALKNKLDPNFEMNSLMKALQGYGGSNEESSPVNTGGTGPQGLGGQNAGTMDEEGLEGIGNMLGARTPQPNMGEGAGMMRAPQDQELIQQQASQYGDQILDKKRGETKNPGFDLEKLMADNSLKGIATKMILQKKAPWLFKALAANKDAAFQGEARNALDMQRLKDKYGEGSEVYQNAKADRDSKQQSRKDLTMLRDRTIEGLKPGERWLKNDKTGEIEGVVHNSTPKEIKQEEGRIMFNELYPLVIKGGAPFSGSESIRKFAESASKYKTDPKARQMVDDYLLNLKVLTAAEVNEAATLDSGKTNQQYSRLRESIKADDIPAKVADIIKKYQLPASAQMHAGYRFLKKLNQARLKAREMAPAQRTLYLNPEAHAKALAAQETSATPESKYSDNDIVMVDGPNGKEQMTYAEAKKKGAI